MMISANKLTAAVLLSSALAVSAHAQDRVPDHADVTYAVVGDHTLALDLYLPDGEAGAPLVVWVHGGAWQFGTKAGPPTNFADSGFALASLDFRQSTDAPFPAMVHDIKAGIRFLRANASRYGYSTDRIVVAGVSSGAHLAALVGVTNGHEELEGSIGDHLDESSSVQAILSYFGASNFMTILQQSTPVGLRVREPALDRLLGGAPDTVPELAKLASPVSHVDASDPPLYLLHGDQDPQMPINQSHELHGVYKQHGLDVRFDVVHGSAHGGDAFFDDEHWQPVSEFLERVIAL